MSNRELDVDDAAQQLVVALKQIEELKAKVKTVDGILKAVVADVVQDNNVVVLWINMSDLPMPLREKARHLKYKQNQ